MKAVVYTKYGTPSVLHLQEVEKPTPKENEVLVKIYTTSVNSWDWDLLKGKPFLVRVIGGLFKPRHKILGADIAGKVEAVGNIFFDLSNEDFNIEAGTDRKSVV